ncbi:MAG: 23S rRNA (pseudouridine(1915)-N(3))-methyltransferase RlmH [Anaerovoracaceae bacterium]|jgi:23S rRNA (pseudouridine1915-N3)-methyltransferase
MNITILCIGKLKEDYWTGALKEYGKRLSSYCNFHVEELKEERLPEGASPAEEKAVIEKEGNALIRKIAKGSHVVTLDIKGKSLSSEEFSSYIGTLGVEGKSHITFIIGGSLGLSSEVLERADFCLSFSPMTFPHQMIRIILAEQVYRAFKILKNESYHK